MVKLGSHRSEPGDDGGLMGLKMMGVSHVVFRGYVDGAGKLGFRRSDLMA